MPAVASIEDLREAKKDLDIFQKAEPEGYALMVQILENHKMIGYKNIAKMARGATPEELKS